MVSQEVPDRVLSSLLSDFYLTLGAEADEELSESIDEVLFETLFDMAEQRHP